MTYFVYESFQCQLLRSQVAALSRPLACVTDDFAMLSFCVVKLKSLVIDLHMLFEIKADVLCEGLMSESSNLTKLKCFLSFSDGELYAGVYVDFMGTDSAIFRTLGTKTAMRTDQYNSRWLNGNSPI